MKIGIACYPTYGGSGVLATELGLALAGRGHEIHFLSYETPIRLRSFRGNVFYHQVSVQEYPLFKYPPYCLALATKMADVAEHHDLDLLHVHYAVPHAVSAHLAQEMLVERTIKSIATLHGTDITIIGSDPSYKRVTRFSIQKANGVTAVSKYLRDETWRTLSIDTPIEVIPNFVDLDRFEVTPCADAKGLRHGDELLLVHVSNFRPVKRIPDLIRAFHLLQRDTPARLLLVGDGPERPAVEALVYELGLGGCVDFLGSQDAVEKIIPCADLFVLPSSFESFGLAALEAMACGVPVVASDAGGIPEVVVDGECGRLFRVGDVNHLADVLRDLVRDRDRLAEMGRKARQRAEEEFSLARILPLYERYYERVVGSDGR